MARNSLNQTYDAPDVCRPVGRLQVSINRLSDLNDRLSRTLDSVEAFGDRMLGAQPVQAAGGKTEPRAVANGTLDALHEQISQGEALEHRLRCAIERLGEID